MPDPTPETGETTPPETEEPTDEVRTLRDEAARRRVEAREATELADELGRRLMAATVTSAAGGLLEDVTDLPDGIYVDDEGFPSAEAITVAAEALVEAKPHLAKRAFPPVDAGESGEVEAPTTIMGAVRQSL